MFKKSHDLKMKLGIVDIQNSSLCSQLASNPYNIGPEGNAGRLENWNNGFWDYGL